MIDLTQHCLLCMSGGIIEGVADANGSKDWEARMRRMEEPIEKNWEAHERIDRNIEGLRASMVLQKENVDKLLGALRELIDRIPPENLR